MLELKDLSLLVPGTPQEIVLVGDISVGIAPGEFVAVVGPSGCGKSTLLKLIAGICEPTLGSVIWKGRDLESEGDLAPHEIGYVPQFSIAYDLLSVEENLDAALRLRVRGLGGARRAERMRSILGQVGLEAIADRPVRVLSGGQRRRLALALEMVTSPELLLCDEVTSGLDPKAEDELVTLLRNLSGENGRTVLSVTHSLRHLAAYDTVLVLHGGQLAYHGPPEMLTHYFQIAEPADLYPQLSLRRPEEWHRSWRKHGKAYTAHTSRAADSPAGPAPSRSRIATNIPALADITEETEIVEISGTAGWEEPGETLPEEREGHRGNPDHGDLAEETAAGHPPIATPGSFSQFCTLLRRRWLLFFRDPSALWLQLALILGFPCLVVIFALDGLPQIQNLSMQHTGDILQQLKENATVAVQSNRAGSLVSGLVMFQVILLTLIASNNAAREIAGERLIFEKEKFGGLRPGAYVASKAAFLLLLVIVQSAWMGIFVKMVCRFPGDLGSQIGVLILVNAAMTAICLGISSLARTAEQASLVCIYLVGFQLPLSGAVLALPQALGWITRPFIAAYWGWSGYLQTLKETRFYDVVQGISQTALSPEALCSWVLASHVILGLFLAIAGCKNSRWPE